MAKLWAIDNLPYKGKTVPAGEAFDADDGDVAILTRSLRPVATDVDPRGKSASTSTEFTTKSELAENESGDGLFAADGRQPSKRGGRYNRRDMRAKE